ncbi:MFS general substrate transporter [Gautieria morchelliformis]|nr:MFS general substrate transporter [Gautieria morchelliformis]
MSDSGAIEKAPDNDALPSLDWGGEGTLPPPPNLTPSQELALYRKLDRRLMPILCLMYLMASMDRGNIGNANIEGLTTQLKLKGNQYNIALTMFFVPYCLCECPANLAIKKFRPSRWLPGITIVWGTIMTLMGIVKTYPQLVGARVCLGVVEAGLFPGVVYYLTLWYPRHALQFRIGLFFGGASVALAFSGLFAYGIGFMKGIGGLEGWSWIFILEGIATVAVGILAAFLIVDYPAKAAFLTPEERAYIVWKKKYDNSTVGEQETFALRYVWDALRDWQLWLHMIIYMSILTPVAGITLFLPSIILGFGFSTAVSQLLTVPAYVFAATMTLVFGHYSDKLRVRYPFILAVFVQLLVGFSIQISSASSGVKYFGIYLCLAGYAAVPGTIAWLGNNLAGQCKRSVGMALQIGLGNLATVIAANIFRTQDAPRYILGRALELMFTGLGFITVPIAVTIYKRINAKRDSLSHAYPAYTVQELRQMGDRAPDFRYTL